MSKEVIINKRPQPPTSRVGTDNGSAMPALSSSELFRHDITLVNPPNILARARPHFIVEGSKFIQGDQSVTNWMWKLDLLGPTPLSIVQAL